MNTHISIQDYLSFGYLYLLILGILKDSIYYHFLGVNILAYSTIIDILLSPIVSLVERPLVLMLFLFFSSLFILEPYIHEKNRDKPWYQKWFNVKERDERFAKVGIFPGGVKLLLLFSAGFFVGTGFGGGLKKSKQIKNNEFKLYDKIEYINGDQIDVDLLGQNSSYIFYLVKDAKTVTIAPIAGNIKKIEPDGNK
jgi:hypothetical protein